MAVISKDTFDPLRRYVSVRLQQGVPIVDADWNEMEDMRRFELRAFLKWFVGDGIPEGNDGFNIQGQNLDNDFLISDGFPANQPADGLARVGRALVDGMDVIIDRDLKYSEQPLHVSKPDSAKLAQAWGVPQIAALPPAPPGSQKIDLLIYLDVWERLVTPTEDPSLVHSGLGVESCARRKREWAVRARALTSGLPKPGDADYLVGHNYLVLASVQRPEGNNKVSLVTDQRRRGMNLITLMDRVQTLFAGTGNAAVNSMVVGGPGALPAGAKLQVKGGAIMPEVGDSESAGILFPRDPGGGSGDRAYIRYHATPGTETTTLRIGIDNDADDTLRLRQAAEDRLIISGGVVTLDKEPFTGNNVRKLNVPGEIKSYGTGGGFRMEDRTATADSAKEWVIYAANGFLNLWSGGVRAAVPQNGLIKWSTTVTDHFTAKSTTWSDVGGMVFTLNFNGVQTQITFKCGGVQLMGAQRGRIEFRLMIDNTQLDFTGHEFHNAGWELRDVFMTWIGDLSPGQHTFKVQWRIAAAEVPTDPTAHCSWYGDPRRLIVVELL